MSLMKRINIAIDGFSGCGKSSTAKEVAKRLEYAYLDTGAMYRAVALFFLSAGTNLNDEAAVLKSLNKINIDFKFDPLHKKTILYLNGASADSELRTMEVSNFVSEVSKLAAVREKLVEIQKEIGVTKGVVMDGRDIGTVVLPDAELKVFMTAEVEIRAERRLRELQELGHDANFDDILQNFKERDLQDSTREVSPLRKAEDAKLLDTSHIKFNQQVQQILDWAYQKKYLPLK